MKKQYQIVDLEIEVSAADEIMFNDDRALADFRVEDITEDTQMHRYSFEMVENLDPPAGVEVAAFPGYRVYEDGKEQIRYIGSVQESWNNAYIRAVHNGNEHRIQLKTSEFNDVIGVKTVLNAMAAEHLVLEKQGVILHASFIEHEGKAILFTAPSETGKSTQADLWVKHRGAEIINGDRAVIRLIDGKPYACGIPFAGSSQYCRNATLPLEAIVYLGQAPETTITKMNFVQGFRKVWEGCTVNTWDSDDLNKAIDIVQQITMQVPVFHLMCTPDESAIIALESEIAKL